MKRNTDTTWVSVETCAHRFVDTKHRAGSVSIVCELCGLQGPPVKVGWLRWWAESRAARQFYQLAQQIDKMVFIVLMAVTASCSMIVDTDTELDTALLEQDTDTALLEQDTDTELDTALLEQDTDTLLEQDTDTLLEQDTDTTDCPWRCEPRKSGIDEPFACSLPWGAGEPTSIVNRKLDCPGHELCCQPWPAPPDGITELCAGQWVCEPRCSGSTLTPNMVCFQSHHLCCEVQP